MNVFPEGERLLHEGLGAIFPAAAIEIRRAGLPVYARTVGGLGGRPPKAGTPAGPDTLFDLASLTKLFTTTAFLALVAAGRTRIDDPFSTL
ncbi:MAG TPA: serine hydrolase domain-containing protein, partial [Ardenticatenaceae bacterium]|nr:serine hydrolase domain-containing protein [Ardenticatenaceae bacterium]